MTNDAVLVKSLVCLAVITAFTAVYTLSVKKTAATYLFGMLAICGTALPDWPFFSRPMSQWRTLLSINDNGNRHHGANHSRSRLKLYSARLVICSAVYGFALYRWWNFIRG